MHWRNLLWHQKTSDPRGVKMHECLEVQDILAVIFEHLQDDPGNEPVANKELFALAITCRAFNDLALEVLWYKQTSLFPLLKTLPRSFWIEKPRHGRDRTFIWSPEKICDLDFSRFDFYARKIRRLDYLPCARYKDTNSNPRDLSCFADLIQLRTTTNELLPNLRHVMFASHIHTKNCSRIFKFPAANSISLSLPWAESDVDLFLALTPTIMGIATGLQELNLGFYSASGPDTNGSPAFSAFVRELPNLRGLSSGKLSLDSSAILHLASLPYLRWLQVPNTADGILRAISTHPDHPFSSLSRLVMREHDLTSFAKLLNHIRPAKIGKLKLHFCTPSSALDVQQMFFALKGSSSHMELQELRLFHYTWESEFQGDIIINGSILAPLLVFINLTCLDLSLGTSFTLDNADIKEMVAAWPRMRYLHLGSQLGWGRPSAVTLYGVLDLVAGCRELKTLGISIDASDSALVPSRQTIMKSHVSEFLTHLDVRDSPLAHTCKGRVAEFLALVFPRLDGMSGAWIYVQGANTYQPLWEEANKMARILRNNPADRG